MPTAVGSIYQSPSLPRGTHRIQLTNRSTVAGRMQLGVDSIDVTVRR
ncbi:MAG: hypothetical protein R3B48_08770 [Kofleriaceae bacterium]